MKTVRKRLSTQYIAFLTILLVGIDLITKTIAQYTKCDLELFAGFGLKYVENKGLAFGWLSQTSYATFIGMTVHILFIFVIYITYRWYVSNRKHVSWKAIFAFTLVISGTIGSIIDRAIFNCVRDFIVIPHYAIINFSDIFITIGEVLVLIEVLRYSKLQKEKKDVILGPQRQNVNDGVKSRQWTNWKYGHRVTKSQSRRVMRDTGCEIRDTRYEIERGMKWGRLAEGKRQKYIVLVDRWSYS